MRKIIVFLLFFGCLIVLGKTRNTKSATVKICKTEVKREYDSVYIKFAVKGFKKIDSVVIQIFEDNAQLYKSKIELVNLEEYFCDTAFLFDKPKSNTKLKVKIQASGKYTEFTRSTEMSDSEAESLAKKIKKADGWVYDDEAAVKEVANALEDTKDLNQLRNVFNDKYNEDLDLFIRKFMTEYRDGKDEFNSNWVFIVNRLRETNKQEDKTGSIIREKEFNSESILHIAHLNYREAITVLILLFLLGIFLIPAISLDENKTTLNRAFRYFLLLAPFFIALAISINIYSGFTTYESNIWRIVKILFFFICSGVSAYYVYINFFTGLKSQRS